MRIPRDGDGGTDGKRRGPGATSGFHLGYRPWLDGLRGLAVLAVLCSHLSLLRGGFLGVDLFFVLSGFLITTLLVQEWQRRGAISLRRFYLRRALRLMPALFTLLIACGIATLFMRPPGTAAALRAEIVLTACFVTNWPDLHRTVLGTLGHTWSLSVEEQFYLLWPAILYGLLRLGVKRWVILFLVCAGILACAVLRAVLVARTAPDPPGNLNLWKFHVGLHTRADALLIGCLVGLLAAWDLLPKSRRFFGVARAAAPVCAAALGYLLMSSFPFKRPFFYGLFTAVALMAAVLLVRLLLAPSRLFSRILEFPPLVGLGRISYAVYLFHAPIIVGLRLTPLGWHRPGNSLLVAGLSISAAALSYFWIERPFLRLKDCLQSPGAGALEVSDGVPIRGRTAA